MSTDQLQGVIKNGVGHLQDAAGGLIGDNSLQAKGKFNEAAGFIQDAVGQAKDNVADAINTATDRSSASLSRLQDQARSAASTATARYGDLEEMVVANPLAAIAIVAVLGVGLGFLLSLPSTRTKH